jgi:hypothetical protein
MAKSQLTAEEALENVREALRQSIITLAAIEKRLATHGPHAVSEFRLQVEIERNNVLRQVLVRGAYIAGARKMAALMHDMMRERSPSKNLDKALLLATLEGVEQDALFTDRFLSGEDGLQYDATQCDKKGNPTRFRAVYRRKVVSYEDK